MDSCFRDEPRPLLRSLWRRPMLVALLSLGAASIVRPPSGLASPAAEPWAVCYTDEPALESLQPYGLLVFDSDAHPALEPLRERGKEILAYLSLGEINRSREYFPVLEAAGLLLRPSPTWPDSHWVDIRKPAWAEHVLSAIVPQILRRGFTGLFLDTIDTPLSLEQTEPDRYHGMHAAAVALIRAIRMHYPAITLMVNRGFPIWTDIADDVDMLLLEAGYATYDFAEKRYRRVSDEDYSQYQEHLRAIRARRADLPIYSLDYWDVDDEAGVAAIYARQRANGLRPYVASIDLQRIVPEPKP